MPFVRTENYFLQCVIYEVTVNSIPSSINILKLNKFRKYEIQSTRLTAHEH